MPPSLSVSKTKSAFARPNRGRSGPEFPSCTINGRRVAKTDFETGRPVSGHKTESGAGVAVGNGATVGVSVAVAGAATPLGDAVGAESRVGSGLRGGGADEQAAIPIVSVTPKNRLIMSPLPKEFDRRLPRPTDNNAPPAANDSKF